MLFCGVSVCTAGKQCAQYWPEIGPKLQKLNSKKLIPVLIGIVFTPSLKAFNREEERQREIVYSRSQMSKKLRK